MAVFALYVFVVLTGSAGLCGHAPLVPRACRWALAWRPHRAFRASRAATTPLRPPQRPPRPAPSWADTSKEAA